MRLGEWVAVVLTGGTLVEPLVTFCCDGSRELLLNVLLTGGLIGLFSRVDLRVLFTLSRFVLLGCALVSFLDSCRRRSSLSVCFLSLFLS